MEWDARCLDAHAHRGALVFGDDDGEAALAHYAIGARLGERSLPEDFDGVLGWGWVDNRPFCAACTAFPQTGSTATVSAGARDTVKGARPRRR